MIRYEREDGVILEVYPERIDKKNKWFVSVTDDKSIKDAEFPSKQKAMTRAKSYMKKHPGDYPSDAYPSMEQGSKF